MFRPVGLFIFAGLIVSAAPVSAQPARTIVTNETQLPRSAYPMPTPPSQLLVADGAAFAPFLKAVRDDVDKTLATYEIKDQATLNDYLATRLAAQMLAGDKGR